MNKSSDTGWSQSISIANRVVRPNLLANGVVAVADHPISGLIYLDHPKPRPELYLYFCASCFARQSSTTLAEHSLLLHLLLRTLRARIPARPALNQCAIDPRRLVRRGRYARHLRLALAEAALLVSLRDDPQLWLHVPRLDFVSERDLLRIPSVSGLQSPTRFKGARADKLPRFRDACLLR